MKKLIIVGTYPNTKYKEEILSQCIDRLSKTDYDLMIVSHYPIPEYIQQKVDFVIYDKENTLEPYGLTPTYHHFTDDFSVEVNNNGHMITVCRNINNGVGLAKHLGYDFFYNIESDNLFSDEDLTKLDDLRDIMFKQGKEMIFFGYNYQDVDLYESLIFGGKPSYFLYKMPLPLWLEDFEKFYIESTLEATFYHYLNKDSKHFLVINQSSESFFTNSEINKINNFAQVEILHDPKNRRFVLWLSNLYENPRSIFVSVNGENDIELVPNGWAMRPILSDDPVVVEIKENGIISNKIFTFAEEDKKKYLEKATISYT